jgi:hypothetical protein
MENNLSLKVTKMVPIVGETQQQKEERHKLERLKRMEYDIPKERTFLEND